MRQSRWGRPRGLRPALVVGVIGSGLTLSALAGCSSGAEAEVSSPTAGAIAACLTAAQEQFGLPVDEASAVEASVEVDDQGWWAVHAITHGGGATRTLACTAV